MAIAPATFSLATSPERAAYAMRQSRIPMGANTHLSPPHSVASMLFSTAQRRKEKSNEESSHDKRKKARMTVAVFIINCLT